MMVRKSVESTSLGRRAIAGRLIAGRLIAGWRVIAVVLLASTAAGAETAQASTAEQSPASSAAARERARELAEKAFVSFDEAQYSDAIEQFSQAIELYDVPTLRVGRAEALMQVGRWIEAAADYAAAAKYVLQPNDSTFMAESQAEATTKLRALEPRIPRLRVDTNAAGVQVTVDGKPRTTLPTNETLKLDPGQHRVVLEASGGSVTHTVLAVEGEVLIVEGPKAAVTPARPVEPKPVPVAPREVRTGGDEWSTEVIVSGAVAAVFGLAALTTGAFFMSNLGTYNDQYEDPSIAFDKKERDHAALKTLGKVNTALCIGTAAALGVTSYFWFAPVSEPSESAAALDLAPKGLMFGVVERF